MTHLYLCRINPDHSVWILCFQFYLDLALKTDNYLFFSPHWQNGRFYLGYLGFKTGLQNKMYHFSLHTTASLIVSLSLAQRHLLTVKRYNKSINCVPIPVEAAHNSFITAVGALVGGSVNKSVLASWAMHAEENAFFFASLFRSSDLARNKRGNTMTSQEINVGEG